MLTRKDFEILAAIIRDSQCDPSDAYGLGARDTRQYITGRLVCFLSANNPAFDALRFVEACDRPRDNTAPILGVTY